jgi:hypothetical protein
MCTGELRREEGFVKMKKLKFMTDDNTTYFSCQLLAD